MKKKTFFWLLFLMIFFLSSGVQFAQDGSFIPGLSEEQIKAIFDSASGMRAFNHIRQLCLHHRWFVSDGYHEAAKYIEQKAIEIGLQNVEIDTFPADGKIYYSTDKSLPKWTVRSASLGLVSPIEKHLVSWAESPITLASYSRSADVTAELVDVGEGTHESDYRSKDVRGKLVLASSPQSGGRIDLVHKLAVLERGAAGVISYRSYYLDDFPDLITWDHIWTHELNGKASTFGFCVSKRMGWELKRLLQKEERVVLHAKVDADISAGNYDIVQGTIPGSELKDQELWFIAHLDHCLPSANDNASGSAAILETARTILSLIDAGKLEKPRRTIRFLWVPEISGTYAYVTRHLEEMSRAVAVINMDMVGQNQKVCGSTFHITKTPDSSPSFLNDLLEISLDIMLDHPVPVGRELTDPWSGTSFFGARDDWQARITGYSGGSDHYVFLGGVINIPATMFGSWPDYFYHTSEDTPDKSDPTQLKRVIILGTMVAASIAQLEEEDGIFLLGEMFSRGIKRLDVVFEKTLNTLRRSDLRGDELKGIFNFIHWTLYREKKALLSVENLLPGNENVAATRRRLSSAMDSHSESIRKNLTDFYHSLCQERGIQPKSIRLTGEEIAAQKLIPLRNPAFPGPISSDYLREKCEEKNLRFDLPLTGLQRFEIAAFIGGKLSALDIRNAVSAELGPVMLDEVIAYIELLEKLGLVTMK